MAARKHLEIGQSPLLFRFAGFELDAAKRELRRQGTVIPLQPKAFDLLRYLVRNRDRVVSKEEILDTIWADAFVTPWSLTSCLRKARLALGTEGDDLLQTFRGHGLRFVGKCEQAAEHAVAGLPPGARDSGPNPARPCLVGREPELAILRQALNHALAGQGSALLVSGPQGIGKSTLLQALSDMARNAGAVPLVGGGYEGEGAPTFWPWIEVVRAVRGAFGNALAARLSHDSRAALATLAPESLSTPAPAIAGDAAEVRFRIFDAVAQLLARAAQLTPLLVAIEDVHWADAVSAALLRFVAHQIATRRVLLVATLRDGTEAASEAVQAEIVRFRSGSTVRTVKLAGLNAQSTQDFVERLVPMPLPGGFSDRIRHATGGVPLLVEQLATHLVGVASNSPNPSAALAAALESVPEASAGIIGQNLAKLSARTRDVLAVAAVVGNDFDLDCVAHVLAAADSAALADARRDVEAAIRQASHARMVTAGAENDKRYGFANGMIRNAIYRSLDSRQRSLLHWLAGKEGVRRLRRGDDEIAAIAEHFVHGVDHGSARTAVQFCLRAAKLASERTDWPRARGLLEHADRVADRDEGLAGPARIEILISLAQALAHTGKTTRAREVAARAVALARVGRRHALFARAVLSSGKTIEPPAVVDRGRIELLEEALARLPHGEVGLRIHALRFLAWEHFLEDDHGASRSRLSQDAVDLARAAGSPNDLLAALYCQFETLAAPDRFNRQRTLASELVALATELRNPAECSRALALEALVLLQLGRLEAADARMQEAERLGKLAHNPLAQIRAEVWRFLITSARGEWAAADGHVDAAARLGEFIDEDFGEVLPFLRVHGLLVRGMARHGITRFPQRPDFAIGHVDALLDAGALEPAREAIESRFPAGVDDFPWDSRWLPLALRFAFTCARLGERARCAHTYDKLLPYDGRHAVLGVSSGAAYFGTVEWGLGVLAGALGRWPEAEKRLAATTAVFRKMSARPFLAVALCDHAEMLRLQGRARDRVRRQRLLDESAVLAEELDLAAVQRRIPTLRRPLADDQV